MIINLLCPTRGRPDKYKKMVNSAIATAARSDQISIWGGQYSNDNSNYDLLKTLHETSGRGAGPYWNQLAGFAHNRQGADTSLYMLVGDDCVFETQGWDDCLRVVAEQFRDGIYCLAPNDKRSGGAPHFVVSNRWIETLGYFVNPAFQHFCVDTYTQHIAEGVGRFIYLEHVVVAHQKAAENHYDQTAARIRGTSRVSIRDNALKKTLIEGGFAQDDINLLKAVMQ